MPMLTCSFEIDSDLYQTFLRQCAEYGNDPESVLVEAVKDMVAVEQEREDTGFWQSYAKTRARFRNEQKG